MSKISKAIRLVSDGFQHRRQVHRFVNFCTDPNTAFSGSVHPNELVFLQELVTNANSIEGPILEIGTLFGFTTHHIAEWKNIDKPLITVDNFFWNPIGFDKEAHKAFTNRILYYLVKRANTQIYEGSNTEFYNSYTGTTPAMVFIDAGHLYEDVLVDITWAKENKIPIISGHDYSSTHPGVIRAVDETFGKENVKTTGSVWAVVS